MSAVIHVGALLAGGQGRRLGRGDKGLVRVGDRPMIARAHDCLVTQVDRIVINANGNPERFQFLNSPVVPDGFADEGGAGPLAGIHAVLAWSTREAGPAALVTTVPVDAPFLPANLVTRLAEARYSTGASISIAGSGGRQHPVVACWPVSVLADLEQALAEGIRKIDAFTSNYRVAVVEWDITTVDPFFNVNTVEDLREADLFVTGSQTMTD
ncbi:MAG: molybdenum cofactor guanylyltransferase MobA [Rhodospirillales bacterium]|nr:molybdenum cofactor guanylyltransferase MobA [Rhodospirillales bacterium]